MMSVWMYFWLPVNFAVRVSGFIYVFVVFWWTVRPRTNTTDHLKVVHQFCSTMFWIRRASRHHFALYILITGTFCLFLLIGLFYLCCAMACFLCVAHYADFLHDARNKPVTFLVTKHVRGKFTTSPFLRVTTPQISTSDI